MVSKSIMVIAGAILVAISIIGIVAFAEVTPKEYVPEDVTFDGPIFAPADGTENFVFNDADGAYTVSGTGIYEYLGMKTYGTLYISELGNWVIIDPVGQISMSGTGGVEHVVGDTNV